MPYNKKSDLPDSVTDNLPSHAEEIYLAAFNNAWTQYKDPAKRKEGGTREEVSHRVAWAAVKQVYHKNEAGDWVKS